MGVYFPYRFKVHLDKINKDQWSEFIHNEWKVNLFPISSSIIIFLIKLTQTIFLNINVVEQQFLQNQRGV